MKKLFALLPVALVLLAAEPAHAQMSDAEKEVVAVIHRMFDGFAKKDTTIMRSTLHDDVKLVTAMNNREGKPVIRAESMDAFLQNIAKADGKLDERLFNPEVRIDDNLATVWVKYEFWFNDQYSHCGYDSFQLAKSETGWKIFSIADTRRKECK